VTLFLYSVMTDAADHRALAAWWSAALDWEVGHADDGIAWAEHPDLPSQSLGVVPVPEPKTVKGRVHLDLRGADQAPEVERLLGLGARRADVGQGPDVSWVVLADPEGNEFCVLEGPAPRPEVAVVAIDAVDPRRVAGFWAGALGTGWSTRTRAG